MLVWFLAESLQTLQIVEESKTACLKTLGEIKAH